MKLEVQHSLNNNIPPQMKQEDIHQQFSLKNEIEYEEISFTETKLEVKESTLSDNRLTKTIYELELSEREEITNERNNACTIQEKISLENNIEEDLIIREKNYEKILRTREKLFIYLKRENLHELQREHNEIERCSICSFVTKRNNIRVKYLTLRRKAFPKCNYCGFQPKNREAIERHIKNVHKIDMIKCKKCSYLGEMEAQLKHHYHQEHGNRKFWEKRTLCCHICKYKALNKDMIRNHCITVHKEFKNANFYNCHLCDFKTKYKGSLRNHEALHNPKRKVYQCQLCPFKTYKFRTLLASHKFKHETSEEAKIYKCHLCPHKTKAKCYLDRHMLVHKKADEVRIYKCDICSFRTPHPSSLGRHMEIHAPNKEKWIPCKLCSYKAKDKSFHEKHMLTHKKIGEVEAYKCERCPFKTKYRSSMLRHAKNHRASDDNIIHPCKFCSYKGKTATHLQQHERMHVYNENGKMHKCEQCPYQCRNLANMKRHYIAHKNLKKLTFFPCDKCKFQATSQKWLEAHRDNVHKIHEDM